MRQGSNIEDQVLSCIVGSLTNFFLLRFSLLGFERTCFDRMVSSRLHKFNVLVLSEKKKVPLIWLRHALVLSPHQPKYFSYGFTHERADIFVEARVRTGIFLSLCVSLLAFARMSSAAVRATVVARREPLRRLPSRGRIPHVKTVQNMQDNVGKQVRTGRFSYRRTLTKDVRALARNSLAEGDTKCMLACHCVDRSWREGVKPAHVKGFPCFGTQFNFQLGNGCLAIARSVHTMPVALNVPLTEPLDPPSEQSTKDDEPQKPPERRIIDLSGPNLSEQNTKDEEPQKPPERRIIDLSGPSLGPPMQSGPSDNAAGYCLMSSIYADGDKWDEVRKIQEMRRAARAWKKPGKAFMELNNQIHEFIVGDKTHRHSEFMQEKTRRYKKTMHASGYIPQVETVLIFPMKDGE